MTAIKRDDQENMQFPFFFSHGPDPRGTACGLLTRIKNFIEL